MPYVVSSSPPFPVLGMREAFVRRTLGHLPTGWLSNRRGGHSQTHVLKPTAGRFALVPKLTHECDGDLQALKRSLHQVNRKDVRVPDAPIFHPTLEEFTDPLKYITGIRHLVQKTGIAKIIPPEGETLHARTVRDLPACLMH